MGWTHGQNERRELPKISETKKQEGCRKRGRSQLRWEDYMNRDQRKAMEKEKCRENVNNNEHCKKKPRK